MTIDIGTEHFLERYAEAIRNGDREAASEVIYDVIENGLDVATIYLDVIVPAQQQVGRLWHDGEINIAQEHLATQIVLGDMHRLRSTTEPRRRLELRALVTAVERDQHLIGARIAADLLHQDGWQIDFLGSDTPTADLIEIVGDRRPDVVVLTVTLEENVAQAKEAVLALTNMSAPPMVIVGGAAVELVGQDSESQSPFIVETDVQAMLQTVRTRFGIDHTEDNLEQYLQSLGLRVKGIRREHKWSQQELSRRSELDRTYISAVENGRQNLTLGAVMKLSNALQVPLRSLLNTK